MIDNILLGASIVFTMQGMLAILAGCILGTIVGILPGIGTVTVLSIILPYTYGISPILSIILLAGIYYGAQYGGSNTSILLNTPGEPSSTITCIDGYAMTKKGQGGKAIVSAGIASFVAGLTTLIFMSMFGPELAKYALYFGPKEMSLMMLMGLLSIGLLSTRNLYIGMATACIGILLGTIGIDINSGEIRFVENIIQLHDGISIPVVAIGFFGITEIFKGIVSLNISNHIPNVKIGFTFNDFKKILLPTFRGTVVGSLFGLLPGAGAIISPFMSYSLEKNFDKRQELGTGSLNGVASPEAANNAAAQIQFIPLLALGIPENAIMAIMLVNLTVAGIEPGPGILNSHPDLFWALLVSMLVGNFILLFLNIPMIKLWFKFLHIPKNIFYPLLLVIALFGVYSINSSWLDIGLAMGFGIIGYIFSILRVDVTPIIFGFLIGGMFEENLRRALILSTGNFNIFFEDTFTIVLCSINVLIVIVSYYINKKSLK